MLSAHDVTELGSATGNFVPVAFILLWAISWGSNHIQGFQVIFSWILGSLF
jgi:hypothetical protein